MLTVIILGVSIVYGRAALFYDPDRKVACTQNPKEAPPVKECHFYCFNNGTRGWDNQFRENGTSCQDSGKSGICLTMSDSSGCYGMESWYAKEYFKQQQKETPDSTNYSTKKEEPTTAFTRTVSTRTVKAPKENEKKNGSRKKCKPKKARNGRKKNV